MPGPLVNIGDLTKPATVLIEKVSEAVCGIAKPWQTRRNALAEADAQVVLAKARIEIGELEQRAIERLIREEAAKQANIEQITIKALPDLSHDAEPAKLEKDWLNFFFDRCRNVSDEEMQSLWAHILAGEANTPGSFARKTIELVSILEKQDAAAFTALRKCCWTIDEVPTALIYDIRGSAYTGQGVTFDTLRHLESLGLINMDYHAGFYRTDLPEPLQVDYFGREYSIQFPVPPKRFPLGCVLLTQPGEQFAAICKTEPVDAVRETTLEAWSSKGLQVSSASA